MQKNVLIPLPSHDFDPTETAVPWKILREAGVQITFATPLGEPAVCDQHMLLGIGLGPLAKFLAANNDAQKAYLEMSNSVEFKDPIKWSEIVTAKFDGLVLPGGHAKGMREYLESALLQKRVAEFFDLNKPIGAICHGVVLAARSKQENGKSILFGRKTTALLAAQELSAWLLTCTWMGNYYRTYPQTVESEVKNALATAKDFIRGPTPFLRDSMDRLDRGFVVKDRNYLSSRWPGDAHHFAKTYVKMLA